MKCYIYKIVNKITGEKYVGQTTNFSRRKENHLSALRNNKHVNPKLQSSWNKYGEENFYFEREQFELTKEELNQKEINEIKKENSYYNGFNLTEGGDGGNTRGKINFEDYCLIYFINNKYQGLMHRTGQIFNIDSSTVSAITHGKAYDWFKEIADKKSNEEKEFYIKQMEKKLDIDNKPPKPKKEKLTEQQIFDFLSVVSCYGRGAEACMTRFLNISKGLKHHLIKGEYKKEVEIFLNTPKELIQQNADKIFNENNLQQYCIQKVKRLENPVNIFSDCAL